MKNRPDPPGKTEFSVRFALINKLKTTKSRAVIASHFSRLVVSDNQAIKQDFGPSGQERSGLFVKQDKSLERLEREIY